MGKQANIRLLLHKIIFCAHEISKRRRQHLHLYLEQEEVWVTYCRVLGAMVTGPSRVRLQDKVTLVFYKKKSQVCVILEGRENADQELATSIEQFIQELFPHMSQKGDQNAKV